MAISARVRAASVFELFNKSRIFSKTLCFEGLNYCRVDHIESPQGLQEHSHTNQQVDFLRLHLLCQIGVVVLEAVAIDTEVGLGKRVVVGYGCMRKLLDAAVHRR